MRVNARHARIFSISAVVSTLVLLALSAVTIYGWMFDIQAIKHPIGNEPSLQSSTAVTFFLLSIALLLLGSSAAPVWCRWMGRAFAVVVLLAGGATFIEHTFELDWGLAHQLWQPNSDSAGLRFPGPMVPDVSLNFVLLGLALLLYNLRLKKDLYPYQILSLLVALPSLMILFSYACGMPHICAYFGCVKFSAITSLTFTLACYSILFTQPDRGLTTIYVADSIGGTQVRRFSGLLLLVGPLVLLIKAGEAAGLYDTGVSLGLMGLSLVSLLGAGVVLGARKLDTVHEEKQQAQEAVEMLENSIATLSSQPSKLKLVCLQCAREFADSASQSLTNCPDDGSVLCQIVDNLKIGCVFAERYEIVGKLGEGGISSVYLARHMLMNKQVAVKVLHTHLAGNTKSVQRFHQEARAASALSHPNLIAVHDFGISPDGQAYLVMEYLNGYSLSEHLKMSGHIVWQDAVPCFVQLCDGLAHAHGHGVIHRDLKPSNVMIVPDEEKHFLAKIVDFGFAKAAEVDSRNMQKLTVTGDVFGSPLYMSPEQCKGQHVDHRSDIYALGCLMFEVLANDVPFMGDTAHHTMVLHVNTPPPDFNHSLGIPTWLRDIVWKALEKHPADRQQSAGEMKAALLRGMGVASSQTF